MMKESGKGKENKREKRGTRETREKREKNEKREEIRDTREERIRDTRKERRLPFSLRGPPSRSEPKWDLPPLKLSLVGKVT